MRIISNIGKNIGTTAARLTGLAAIGLVAYDAHTIGKLEADTYSQSREAKRLTSAAHNNTNLDKPSVTMSKIKRKIFNFQLETSILMPFEAFIGYFKGFGSHLADALVPFGLGLGALFGPGHKVPKMSALGLIIYGGYRILQESFGLGKVNRINPPFK